MSRSTPSRRAGAIDACAVIGAGPAGLSTALYLARYHRRVRVFDAGSSRAAWIPRSHNVPGYPDGVSGEALLTAMRAQVQALRVPIVPAVVEDLRRDVDDFVLVAGSRRWRASRIVLATGVRDTLPPGEGARAAIDRGVLRLCPVCDGYEASDQRIAVYGPLASALSHALYLRSFSQQVAVTPAREETPGVEALAQAQAAGVELLRAATTLEWGDRTCRMRFVDASEREFDSVYAALGSAVHSRLARDLGAEVDGKGELIVDGEQCTSLPGLYAVGDVVSALNQITVAMGQAAVAASAIHRDLPPHWRCAP